MKKILAIVLAFAVLSALSVNVFAAGAKTDEGLGLSATSNNVDVIIDTTTVDDIAAVYYVDVTWESLDLHTHSTMLLKTYGIQKLIHTP